MATRYAAIPAIPQGNLTGASTIVLITALKDKGVGRVVPFKFVKHGVDVWRQ